MPDFSSTDLFVLAEFASELAAAPDLIAIARAIRSHGQRHFAADAACTFVRRADDRLELLAQDNCTPRFVEEWRVIPSGSLGALFNDRATDFFLGSAADFKADSPGSEELVDRSHRLLIGYVPLRAGDQVLGVFGFSFNREPLRRPDPAFARTYANIAGLALSRYRILAPPGDGRLMLVRSEV